MDIQFIANADPMLASDPSSRPGDTGIAGDHALSWLDRGDVQAPAISSGLVRSIIKARKARREFFGSQLFADPAWDILLELYALECEQHRISVSKLSITAGVPGTTGLRWVDRLEADGLVTRSGDALDARRVWIRLSAKGSSAMSAYFERMAIAFPAY